MNISLTKKKNTIKKEGQLVPLNVVLKTRIRDDKLKSQNPFVWRDVTTNDLFNNKRVVVFSLPGAFTPVCSTSHLPDYDKYYNKICSTGIDEVYCISVNDAFVMYNWAKHLGIKNIKLLPDGSGDFTKRMGALVKKDNLGFGRRSWRYAMIVDNGRIEKMFVEPGFSDNCRKDPFKKSSAMNILKYLEKYY
jgi:thioredoxin-dependent peroxiredoxin